MKKLLAILFLAGLFFAVGKTLTEAAPPEEEFTILSFSPSGTVRGIPAIKASFSLPVVPKASVGKALAGNALPFSFSPSLRGEGKWTDERTFVFSPLARLPQATLFRATADPSLRDARGKRLAGQQVFEFSTEPLKILGIHQTDYSESKNVLLELEFSLPVSPLRLRGFLNILNPQKQSVAYSLRTGVPSTQLLVSTAAYDGSKLTAVLAPGLTSDAGPLGIQKEYRQEIPVTKKMEIRNAYAESRYPGQSAIVVSTTAAPAMSSVSRFVELSPKTGFSIEPGYNGFSILGDFRPRQRVEVSIRKGLPGHDGKTLEKDYRKAVIFPDLEPAISFPSAGTFLSPAGDLRVPLETVNIEEVALNLWRVYENNIPLSMTLPGYSIPRELTRRIASRTARPGGMLNEPARRAIDLRELAGETRGVFLLTASSPNEDYWGEAEQLVAVTDLGLVARLYPDGITVWVNTILGLKPVKDAAVKVYSRSNQTLASGSTDQDGLWSFRRTEAWDSQLLPALVTVEKDSDVSFLKLDGNLFADTGFDTGGRPRKGSGYEAFVFTPRGVFRPGEEVHFSAVVRDSRRLPPEPFPVLWVIRSSLGREVARGTAILSREGSASFSASLAPASPTGTYSASVSLPGQEGDPLGRTEFFVEDFVAPRLEVKAEPDLPFLSPGKTVKMSVASSYLFGAPAAGLPFEGEVRAAPAPFRPSGWEAFSFGDGEKTFEAVTEFMGDGSLDGEGRGILSFSAPAGWSPPAAIDLHFIVKVMEESGRWVPATRKLLFHPYPFYLGIETSGGEPAPGKELSMRVAAATPEGKPAGLQAVSSETFMVKRHYNLVRTGNQTRMQEQRELVPQGSGSVPLKEGVGTFSFVPKSQGEYLVRFRDQASGSSASASFMVWAPFGTEQAGGSTLLDRIAISADKERYAPGETAEISFRSPFGGTLLVTVETDRELLRKTVNLDRGQLTLQVPITEDMIPNAYVTAWVIRPVTPGEPWGSHRALGTLSIPVERKEKRLSVSLSAPERVEPGTDVSVGVKISDGAGIPRKGEVVLFLVDEGILSLTGYATPDPWDFFMAKRALGVFVFDIYDQLLPLESRETPLLRAGGGEGEDAMAAIRAALSPVAARSFRLLSVFAGNLPTNDSGEASATLRIPEFSGKGRLMAVAFSGDCFGKADSRITIAREITAELSLPRAVSPGDAFHAPLKVYSAADGKRRAKVTISASGPLALTGKKEFIADLDQSSREALFNVAFRAGDEAGTAKLTVEAQWEGGPEEGRSSQCLDLPVRPPYPRISLSGSGIVRSGSPVRLEIPRNWHAGTEEGRLLLSDFPALDLAGAAFFLMGYPYGCLEQTVSGAWPLLVLPDLVKELDPGLVNQEEVQAALALRIRQISAMQLYFGSFAGWPGSSVPSEWGSIYATHFLVEAKKSGVTVPEELLGAALDYVRQRLALSPSADEEEEETRENLTIKAYASYVLALTGEAPLGWMAHIRENSSLLRSSGAIFLAGAYALASNNSGPLEDLGSALPSLRAGDGSTFESPSRATALKLLMWTAVDPLSAPAAELAFRLLEEGRKKTWKTTQDNAVAVLALGRWMEKTQGARKPFSAVLRDGSGKELAAFSNGKRLSLNLGDLPAESLSLELAGEGTAHYAWVSSGVPSRAPEAASRGIAVTRTWKDRKGNPLAPGTPLQRGARIEAILTLTPAAPLRDLVVVDMLPGGMEIENMRLSGSAEEEGEEGETPSIPAIRAEMRDDRLILFVNYLGKPQTYSYLLRAVTRGTFILPPLAAEGMYAPDISAVTSAGKVEILQ